MNLSIVKFVTFSIDHLPVCMYKRTSKKVGWSMETNIRRVERENERDSPPTYWSEFVNNIINCKYNDGDVFGPVTAFISDTVKVCASLIVLRLQRYFILLHIKPHH